MTQSGLEDDARIGSDSPHTRVTQMSEEDVLKPQLSFVAARAAIQLDAFASGRDEGTDAIDHLVSRLDQLTKVTGDDDLGRSTLFDPFAVDVLSGVMSSTTNESASFAQLDDFAHRLSAMLLDVSAASDREVLCSLRSFCLALSEHARNYSFAQYQSSRPERPHRK